jgi:hypothetical protein
MVAPETGERDIMKKNIEKQNETGTKARRKLVLQRETLSNLQLAKVAGGQRPHTDTCLNYCSAHNHNQNLLRA